MPSPERLQGMTVAPGITTILASRVACAAASGGQVDAVAGVGPFNERGAIFAPAEALAPCFLGHPGRRLVTLMACAHDRVRYP